ncbi:MAG TPA: response regulator [Crinalium sp.]|jgi:CheY-like chemotaxis protein
MDLELSSAPRFQPSANRPLILVVEDNEDNLMLLLHVLDLFGFSCISTQEGRAVFNLARDYQPDLILLDVVLPGLSGLEVIPALKQDPATASIPIIAVTALAKQEDRERLLQMGCDDYLDKPYDLSELEAMVHHHLSQLRMPSAS